MSVALNGNLEDFGIADVFQLIGQQRKTGVLEFAGDAGTVQLRFDRGAVVSAAPASERAEDALGEMLVRCGLLTRAQSDLLIRDGDATLQTVPRLAVGRAWVQEDELERVEDLLTRETFFDVLRWERGKFHFRAQAVEHRRRFESLLGAEQILMDGLRMVDEWQSFAEHVPSEETVFQRSTGLEEYRRDTSLDEASRETAERIYHLVDGRIPVRRIVDLSMLGSFDAVRLMVDLVKTGTIEALGEEAVKRLQTHARPSVLTVASATSWIVALVPLLILAAALGFVLRPAAPAPAGPGWAVPKEARRDVAAAFEALRLRKVLETHRLSEGRWPEGVSDLADSERKLAGPLALYPVPAYYYAKRGEGVLLLAPQR